MSTISLNIADRLATTASQFPHAVAVAVPRGYRGGRRQYDQVTFAEMDADVTCLARGLVELGVVPGMRLALLVRPGREFVTLVFALFRAGAVVILIDPGMGKQSLVDCLQNVNPDGFVAIPAAHAVRVLLASRFPAARIAVTVGRRWFWGGSTLTQLRRLGERSTARLPTLGQADPAAIIFTSGSTGPAKGVLYQHQTFDAQVDQIRGHYGIEPGGIDLAGFPLFGLFNCAMGVTTVVPDMDASRPAKIDPERFVETIEDWGVTQSFGSPAIWRRVGAYCQKRGIRLNTLRRVLSAGAPVPARVLASIVACLPPEAEIHTPYGATEALPVASISAHQVLGETAAATDRGAGVCVGSRFSGIQWKIIRATERPISRIEEAELLPPGEIGELIVCGRQVTRAYVTGTEWNARTKIIDGDNLWHRMGDVGYFDTEERFWYCGRLSQRVLTAAGPLYTECCEAIFNRHAAIERTALVGVGSPGTQRPLIVAQPQMGQWPHSAVAREALLIELRAAGAANPLTTGIEEILLHKGLPVDPRHNAKIAREQLAVWAAKRLPATRQTQTTATVETGTS